MLKRELQIQRVRGLLEYRNMFIPVIVMDQRESFGRSEYLVQPYSPHEPLLQGDTRWVEHHRVTDYPVKDGS